MCIKSAVQSQKSKHCKYFYLFLQIGMLLSIMYYYNDPLTGNIVAVTLSCVTGGSVVWVVGPYRVVSANARGN